MRNMFIFNIKQTARLHDFFRAVMKFHITKWNKPMRIRQSLLAIAMLLFPFASSAAEIAVTLPPLAGLVLMLDKRADVMCLMPAGSDPHHFQMTPRKIETLNNSRLLIRAAFDDAGWPLPPSHSSTLKLWPRIDHGWLNPSTVRDALPLIAKAMIQLHPKNSKSISSALVHALQQTHDIEQAWRMALAGARATGVLMQHPSWRRLMQSMDVPVLAVLESSHHGLEHGPHKLEQALRALDTHPEAWLLADHAHSNKSLAWLAQHAHHPAHRITLDPLGSCGLTWPELMRHNIALIDALPEQKAP